MMRREKVVLTFDIEDVTAGLSPQMASRMKRVGQSFKRVADQNSHPLDRAEPGEPTPLRWRGDDS